MRKRICLVVILSLALAVGSLPAPALAQNFTSNEISQKEDVLAENSMIEVLSQPDPATTDKPSGEEVLSDGSNSSSPGEFDEIIDVGQTEPEESPLSNDGVVEHPATDLLGDKRLLAEEGVSISYRAHVAEIGWMDSVKDGVPAGTTGRTLHMEALEASLGSGIDGDLNIEAHVANIGWMDAVSAGEVAGTTGRALQMEAVRISLTGAAAQTYDVYYRAHSANFGWLGWATNGQDAGSQGFAYGMESIEIRLVVKGSEAPGATEGAFKEPIWKVNYEQMGESTVCRVTIPMLDYMLSTGEADSVKLTASMSFNSETTREVSVVEKLNSVPAEGLEFDFKAYGPFMITADYIRDGRIVGSASRSVEISSSQYNLAPLSASFPVLLFSLSMWDVTQNGSVPTVLMLDRPSAYDWDSLPTGAYGMPYLSESAIQAQANYEAFAQYVADLYRMNPDAVFNLYVNDITCSYAHRVLYANGIPEGNYTITLLSDGIDSAKRFNTAYSSSDPEQAHSILIDSWNTAKKEAYETGKVSEGYAWHEHMESAYAVLACEPSAQWWVARGDLFTSGDSNVFARQAGQAVVVKSVASMLASLQSRGDDVVQAFKRLYNFNDGYFSEAEKQGKEVMLLLGARVTSESNFKDYARLAQAYYGEEYLYYYKGHPLTPTGLHPSKQKDLQELGIIDVDSSVAAELILFFNPDISLSGYGTSVFNSASDDMAGGLFGWTKVDALVASGVDYSVMDWFASPADTIADPAIRALCPDGSPSYLVEFSDVILSRADYDFAIFDAAKMGLSYYKMRDGQYVFVRFTSNTGKVSYSAHVSNIGWQTPVKDGGIAGTTGQNLPMEAVRMSLPNQQFSGSLEYAVSNANSGWQDWVKDGAIAGTVGQRCPMEAIQIRLAGEVANFYDVYYRAHSSNFGWLGWAKNGEVAGTAGNSCAMEALQIQIVEKGGTSPGDVAGSFIQKRSPSTQ